MLDQLRSAASSWTLRIFLGILLISFVLWEVPNSLRQQSGNTLLASGRSAIRAQTYQLVLNDTVIRNSFSSGRYLTKDEIRQFAIPQRVFNRLYTDVLLDEEIRRMKISASDAATARLVGQDPLFRDGQGRFDKNRFSLYAREIGIPQEEYFGYINMQAKRNQLTGGTLGGLKAPDTLYSALDLYQNETRAIDYVELGRASAGTIAGPDEKTLADWFENNRNRFSAPEYRQITYMRMSPEDMARPQDVSEEAVQAFYAQNRDRYSLPEKRIIEQLRFKTRETADAAAAKLAAGTPFENLVAAEKQTLKGIRLGPLTKAELPALMVDDVFDLEKGGISAVINDLQGPVLVRIADIVPAKRRPLADVQAEIRNEIADTTAVATLRDNQKKIENARFEGATLKELAAEYGLAVREITIDANGRTPAGKKAGDLPEAATLIPYAFQSTAGVDTDPISSGNGYLWYHVDRVIPSRERPLDEVRDRAAAIWKEEKIQSLLDEKAAAMKKELGEGVSLDLIASRNRLVKKTERGLRRTNISKALGEEATMAAFSGPRGTIGVARGPGGESRIIFRIQDIAEPPGTGARTLTLQERTGLSARLKEGLTALMVLYASTEHRVTINDGLLVRLMQQE